MFATQLLNAVFCGKLNHVTFRQKLDSRNPITQGHNTIITNDSLVMIPNIRGESLAVVTRLAV